MNNRITISKTKLAPVSKMYNPNNDKFIKPYKNIDFQRYKDSLPDREQVVYTEALNNQVNKDYKVGYASDSITLIQSFDKLDSWNKLKEFANFTDQSDSFYKILLAKNNELYPALRSTASNNVIKYHKSYIKDKISKKYDSVTSREKPASMITIDI